jgi:hypothetical protein
LLEGCTSVLGLKPLWAWQHMWLVLAGDVIVGHNTTLRAHTKH